MFNKPTKPPKIAKTRNSPFGLSVREATPGFQRKTVAQSELGPDSVMKPKLSEGSATGSTSALTGIFGNPKRFAEKVTAMAPSKFAEMMRKMGGGIR